MSAHTKHDGYEKVIAHSNNFFPRVYAAASMFKPQWR